MILLHLERRIGLNWEQPGNDTYLPKAGRGGKSGLLNSDAPANLRIEGNTRSN